MSFSCNLPCRMYNLLTIYLFGLFSYEKLGSPIKCGAICTPWHPSFLLYIRHWQHINHICSVHLMVRNPIKFNRFWFRISISHTFPCDHRWCNMQRLFLPHCCFFVPFLGLYSQKEPFQLRISGSGYGMCTWTSIRPHADPCFVMLPVTRIFADWDTLVTIKIHYWSP